MVGIFNEGRFGRKTELVRRAGKGAKRRVGNGMGMVPPSHWQKVFLTDFHNEGISEHHQYMKLFRTV